MDSAYVASRYGKGTADYINCPFTKDEYDAFWNALTTAEEAPVHGFEDSKVFEGCMPIEVNARRGYDTMRFGILKPIGLPDPKTGKDPYAVLQLRRDNAQGTLYNLVGCQTHLKWGEQKRVFSMIPALRSAEFVRYGVMHRNTFLDSPRLLDATYALKADPRIRFAGQMTGVEGYVAVSYTHLDVYKRQGDMWDKRRFRRLSLHTKLVLVTTVLLLAAGTGLTLLFEWNNPATLGALPAGEKVLAAAFQSVTLRTAGFNTIDQAALAGPTQALSCLLMMIGGSPGSTAGGIKTVSAAVLVLSAVSALRGRTEVSAFGRSIGVRGIMNAVTMMIVGGTLSLTGACAIA